MPLYTALSNFLVRIGIYRGYLAVQQAYLGPLGNWAASQNRTVAEALVDAWVDPPDYWTFIEENGSAPAPVRLTCYRESTVESVNVEIDLNATRGVYTGEDFLDGDMTLTNKLPKRHIWMAI